MSKQKIINTALKVFAKKGYNGISVDALVAKANVNKSTLYYYFKGKKELFDFIIEKEFSKLIEELKTISDIDSQEEKLKTFIDIFMNRKIELVQLMEREMLDGSKNIKKENLKLMFEIYTVFEQMTNKKNDIPFILDLIIGSTNHHILSYNLKKNILKNVEKDIKLKTKEEFKEKLFNTIKGLI
jgi:AcrR family transcriptional regulator